ncbi:MAG: hypothetical protein V3U52_04225 [Thermoplasmata archaeon]
MPISPPILVLAFLAFIASLFFPLFLVPELLQRRGISEWKARLVGWITYPAILTVLVALLTGSILLTLDALIRWEAWLGIGVILFAAWWDIRRARKA